MVANFFALPIASNNTSTEVKLPWIAPEMNGWGNWNAGGYAPGMRQSIAYYGSYNHGYSCPGLLFFFLFCNNLN